MTTLKETDGKTTTDLEETMRMMVEQPIPKDDDTDDTDYHKQTRAQAKEQTRTVENREYTKEEVKNAIEELNPKKSPGEDDITADIYQRVYKQFPITIYTLYSECLRRERFPKMWKKSKNSAINKTRQGKLYGSNKIYTNKSDECGRESYGKPANK